TCTMNVSDYVRAANRATFVVVQIEDPQALENVHAIAAVDGVDILFFGPADFSIRSGIAGQFDHLLNRDAVRRIAKAAAAPGKQWGMSAGSVAKAKEQLQVGARFSAARATSPACCTPSRRRSVISQRWGLASIIACRATVWPGAWRATEVVDLV